jgi:hypothetical protein
MAQERTMTMTWIVLGKLWRRLPVVRLLLEFEGRLKVRAHCHRLGRAHCPITVCRPSLFSTMRE